MQDFTNTPHGLLEVGTETPLGTIERVSFTAYLIEGTWVPFEKVHGPYKPVERLVTLIG